MDALTGVPISASMVDIGQIGAYKWSMAMIGLEKGTVKVVTYDPVWMTLFEQERISLLAGLGNNVKAIEHIGSTAIPGMPSKPIIDFMIGITPIDKADDLAPVLEQLSYQRRPFKPGSAAETNKWEKVRTEGDIIIRTHYVRVIVYDSMEWQQRIQFRDYLRNEPAYKRAYAELKQQLARQYPEDREKYSEGKSAFVQNVLLHCSNTLD
jgi:GrpB-like predicted nucleotidyltransferase (UPF0157 family)